MALIGISNEDTTAEIAPLANKIIGAKLWNEGLKAETIRRLRGAGNGAVAAAILQNGGEESGNEVNGDAVRAEDAEGKVQPLDMAEEMWRGKPWKTSVADLEGEILCGAHSSLPATRISRSHADAHFLDSLAIHPLRKAVQGYKTRFPQGHGRSASERALHYLSCQDEGALQR